MSDFVNRVEDDQNFVSENRHVHGQRQEDILTVAKGSGVSLVGSVLVKFINYLFSATLIWGVGAESFGLFTLALATSTFVGVISNIGLPLGIVRFGATYTQTKNWSGVHKTTMAALRVTLSMSALFTILLVLSSNGIANDVFHKPELTLVIRALGISIPFMSIQATILAGMRALKVVKYSVIVWVVQPLIALILTIPVLILGLGIKTVSLVYVFSFLVGATLSVYFYLRLIPRKFRSNMSWLPIGNMIRFSIPLSVTNWVHYVNQRTEIFFLGLLPGAVDIGIYNIAWGIAGLETIFHLSIDKILAPISSELSQRRDIEKLNAIYKTTTKWAFTGALILFLIISFSSKTIMGFFDPLYEAGTGVLVILGFAQLVNAATGTSNTILIMSGYSYLSLLNTILLLVVSIALDWLLIPQYALVGAAVAGALTVIIVNILRVIEVWFVLKIHPFKWSFTKPILAGISGLITVFILRTVVYSGGLLADMGYSILMGVIYVFVIYFLKLDDDDRFVLRAISQKLNGMRSRSKVARQRSSQPHQKDIKSSSN